MQKFLYWFARNFAWLISLFSLWKRAPASVAARAEQLHILSNYIRLSTERQFCAEASNNFWSLVALFSKRAPPQTVFL
jgi:hypothetical protein